LVAEIKATAQRGSFHYLSPSVTTAIGLAEAKAVLGAHSQMKPRAC